jgi:DNA-binding transcriptional LysR family regulator
MLPDIDSLALFVRVAEMRNLTRAAEASFITVPAASRRLSLLEHQFKAQLFERHSRGMALTPAGERLLSLAREVIASVHHMRAEMGNYESGRQSVLRIQGNTSAMTQFLPGDIASFQSAHDDVLIVMEECWSEDAVRRVRSGDADVGVVVQGCEIEGLWTRPYRRDRLAAVVRVDDPLSNAEVAFEDLLERDLVGLEGSSTLTRLLTAQASSLMRPMALRVQVSSFEARRRQRHRHLHSKRTRMGRFLPRGAARTRAAARSSRGQQCRPRCQPTLARWQGRGRVCQPFKCRPDRPPDGFADGLRQRQWRPRPDRPPPVAHAPNVGGTEVRRGARAALDHRVGRRRVPPGARH